MKKWGGVSADPLPFGSILRQPCFACASRNPRRPSQNVFLTSSQIVSRAIVDTGNIPNPFSRLNQGSSQSVSLYTNCRDGRLEWQVIANPRRYGKNVSRAALSSWKSRCHGSQSTHSRNVCMVCSNVEERFRVDSEKSQERNPSRDWTLLNMLASNDNTLKASFVLEFCRLSQCQKQIAQSILADPSKAFLCYLHLNHSRYAQKSAVRLCAVGSACSTESCIFKGKGCSSPSYVAHGRLWRIPTLDVNSPSTLEAFSEMEESVCSHSDGGLRALDVMGKFSCRSCHYIVLEGRQGRSPPVSLQTLSSPVDMFTLRCILFSLEKPSLAAQSPLAQSDLDKSLRAIASTMRNSCLLSNGNRDDSVRMLPFQEVCRARKELCSQSRGGDSPEFEVADRTLEKRLEPVLAAKQILLKRLCSERVYSVFISVLQLEESCTLVQSQRHSTHRAQ